MLLWIVFAVLTALAAVLVVSPYWRRDKSTTAQTHDVEVYKQQLVELEEEHARGIIGDTEAESARIEISRRLLNASKSAESLSSASASSKAPYAMIGAIAVISMTTYLYYGSPQLPDQPISARVEPQGAPPVDELVARVEERVKTNPQDGEGWSVIAHVYMRTGRYAEAANAYRKAIEILGATPERWSDLGEALIFANNGIVIPEASEAFSNAFAADADDLRASFWLVAEKEQKGELPAAAEGYRELVQRDFPAEVKDMIRTRLAHVEARISGNPVETPQQQAQTTNGPTEEQQAMIDQMVSGLAERLQADGSDLDGWLKLMRAYTVLGRRDDAMSAWKQAQQQFAGNDQALGRIDEFAKSLGLQS
ncbi:MAG: c-type cytochrome biogenesis protein CcmI [Rhodomicrobiaceae bacterium]